MSLIPKFIITAKDYIVKLFSESRWLPIVSSLTLLIIFFLVTEYFLLDQKQKEGTWLYYLNSISKIALTGGFFTMFLKMFQFAGVVEEIILSEKFYSRLEDSRGKQLNEIFNSDKFSEKIGETLNGVLFDSKYLKKDKGLDKIWRDVTTCFIQDEFPDIHKSLSEKLKNIYFNDNFLNFYYENWNDTYTVKVIDGTYIQLTKSSSYYIKRKNTEKFSFSTSFRVDKDVYNKVPSVIEFSRILVDSKDIKNLGVISEEPLNKEVQIKEEEIYKQFDVDLEGKTSYFVEIETKMIYPFISEYEEFYFYTKKIVNNINVELIYDKNEIIYKFVEIGLENFEKKNKFDKPTTTSDMFSYKGLFLPENGGYKFYFKLKNFTMQKGGGGTM
ncbi:hypothetical protein [Flavobacterium sp.]|uniref:hypothetical protein n=1 Tax=Flavobacterium sp. TaxID=239 RepID=UPI0026367409|nr:hypothetical protein [Flavobacterium sp.]MDD2987138.1 hypothetical protein [Flavobacterium sp.]